jgi:hypothetical protein
MSPKTLSRLKLVIDVILGRHHIVLPGNYNQHNLPNTRRKKCVLCACVELHVQGIYKSMQAGAGDL